MKKFIVRNSSTILTYIGGAGVIATTILAVKATPKALQLIEDAKEEKGEDLTKLEVIKSAGPAYIPTAITGVATITCIFGANVLNKRRQASMASAYALLDQSYKEYKKKSKEVYGEDAVEKITEEIAKDKREETDITVEPGCQLFYDVFSDRYFSSTLDNVRNAQYKLNREITVECYATLNEYYEFLGIPGIDGGDELGWSAAMNFDYYWQSWVDFNHETVADDDGTEYQMVYILHEPFLEFNEY
jgi:hypothetical protein